jgi:hypothetical protein
MIERITTIAYPLRVGVNGDIAVNHDVITSIIDGIRLVLDNQLGTIAGFPHVGNPIQPFEDGNNAVLHADQLMTIIPEVMTQIASIKDVVIKMVDDDTLYVSFSFTTRDGKNSHYSSNHYITR